VTDRPLAIPNVVVLTEEGVERLPVLIELELADELAPVSDGLQDALTRRELEDGE
jgi:hypothetical protein